MKKLILPIMIALITTGAFAAPYTIYKPASKQKLQDFKKILGPNYADQFSEPKPPVDYEYSELYIADINNDGVEDYLLVSRKGGTARADSLVEAFDIQNQIATPLHLDNIQPDGANMALWFHRHFLVKDGNNNYIQTTDRKHDFRYLWKDSTFTLIGYKKIKSATWEKAKSQNLRDYDDPSIR